MLRDKIFHTPIDLDSAVPLSQTSAVRTDARDSKTFDILFGVRQGCVLSPRLFCAAFESAMSEWRGANPQGGMDLCLHGKKGYKIIGATFGSGRVDIARSHSFPEAPLDATMQSVFYQKSTLLFRNSWFFNSMLRCKEPAIYRNIYTYAKF